MKIRKIMVVLVCAIMMTGLFIEASAASSRFFVESYDGYRCTGGGSISGLNVRATFGATQIQGQNHIPEEDCSSIVWLEVKDRNGMGIGSVSKSGSTSVVVDYQASYAVGSIVNAKSPVP